MTNVSTLGLSLQSVLQIRDAQLQLGDLSGQLATGKKSLDLADYTLTEGRRILDFRSTISKRSSFLEVINTVRPRLQIYDKTMNALDTLGNDALRMVNGTQNSTNANTTAIGEQLKGFINQVQYLLNQKLGDRYIFAGTRYTTVPLQDLNSLPVPPVETTATTSPTLPTYDSAAPGSSTAAFAKDSATIDAGYSINYGVSSNDSGFQKLILGLRWAYAATQDSNNYSNYMDTARTLLTQSLSEMRQTHGNVVSNIGIIDTVQKQHKALISDLNSQVDDIQKADSAEVSTKITFLQSQLEASYSVTAKIASLSLAKYI